jgi:hypothetical protein
MSLTGSRESLARSASCKRYEVYSDKLLGRTFWAQAWERPGSFRKYRAGRDQRKGQMIGIRTVANSQQSRFNGVPTLIKSMNLY